jgi:hypothetical protein
LTPHTLEIVAVVHELELDPNNNRIEHIGVTTNHESSHKGSALYINHPIIIGVAGITVVVVDADNEDHPRVLVCNSLNPGFFTYGTLSDKYAFITINEGIQNLRGYVAYYRHSICSRCFDEPTTLLPHCQKTPPKPSKWRTLASGAKPDAYIMSTTAI